LRPCNWEEAYHVGGDNAEGEYFLFLEYDDFENDGSEPGNAPLMGGSLEDYLEEEYFHIYLDQELTINAGDNFLIATHDALPALTDDADELTDFIHPDNLVDEDGEQYRFIWLVLEDAIEDLYVIDTYDLATLNGGVAKRNYVNLAAEIDDGCENGECWSEYQWGMSIYGYKENTWSVQSATECNPIDDVGTIPESACVEEDGDGGDGDEDEPTESPEEDSGTNSPTMAPTKNPTRMPTTNPTASPTDASTSTTSSADAATGTADSSGSSSSKSVTSEIWFFIVLFIAGMVACGFFMYFCKRGESVDAGFIAAADYEEGFHGADVRYKPGGRGSLILMQPVAKNLAMMDGEDAHFDDDGMGDTPSASRVRESRIVKQREGEMDQNLEGLPTGHQVIKASQISNQSRSIGSFDSEPGSEPGSLPGSIISKRTPQTDEVGEVDITSLE